MPLDDEVHPVLQTLQLQLIESLDGAPIDAVFLHPFWRWLFVALHLLPCTGLFGTMLFSFWFLFRTQLCLGVGGGGSIMQIRRDSRNLLGDTRPRRGGVVTDKLSLLGNPSPQTFFKMGTCSKLHTPSSQRSPCWLHAMLRLVLCLPL